MAEDNSNNTEDTKPKSGAEGVPANTSALSLSQLIGAPIQALIEAEAQAAMATAQFIRNVGFTRGENASTSMNELGDLQMARFNHTRIDPDGNEESFQVEIPLITMLPIPALQIRDAELEYTVKVLDTEVTSVGSREAVEASSLGLKEAPATLRATLARDVRSDQRRSLDMLLKMKVNIEQSDMPAGLAKLLNMTVNNISQKTIDNVRSKKDEHD